MSRIHSFGLSLGLGSALAIAFWAADAGVWALLLGNGTFYEGLFEPGAGRLWLRGAAALFIAGASLLGGRMRSSSSGVEKRAGHLESILRSSTGMAVVAADLDLRITYFNPMAEEIFGYKAEEVLGRTVQELHAREKVSPERFKRAMERVVKGGECSYRIVRERDGNKRIIESKVAGIRDDEGVLRGFVLTSRDISEEQRIEDEHHRFQCAVEQSPNTVVITNTKGEIEYVNHKFTELTGYTREEVIGRNPRILKSGKHTPEFYKDLWDTITSGREWRGEILNKKKNGELYWVSASISPITDENGRITHFISVKEDITERKHSEEALKRSEARLREAEQVARLGHWELDLTTNRLYWSDEVYRIFGLEPSGFDASYEAFLELVHPEDRDFVNRAFRESVEKRKPYEVVHRLLLKDGTVKYVNERCVTIYDDQGRPLRSLGTVLDVTESKRNEEALKRSFSIQSVINKLLRLSMEDISLERMLECTLDMIISIPWLSVESMGGIWLVDEESGALELKAGRGLPPGLEKTCTVVPRNTCLCGEAAGTGKVVFASCLDHRHRTVYEGMTPHGHYCVPIKGPEGVMGVINMFLKEGHHRDDAEEQFLISISDILAGLVRRHRAEKALRESEERFHRISSAAQDAIIMVDSEGRISYWNPASERIFGYTSTEAVGRPLRELVIPDCHLDVFRDGFEKFTGTGRGPVLGRTLELRARRKNGAEFPVEVSISSVKIKGVWHAIAILRDITERKESEEMVRRMAYYDCLTGLPNRTLLMDRINQVLLMEERHRLLAALFFIDLDRFKDINDTLGHVAGDELLKAVSERLRSKSRKSDTVARLGGDEFVVLVQDIGKVEDVTKVAEYILGLFDEPFRVRGREFFVTASMGVSIYPHDGKDPETLLKNADVAMYRAKEEGRNSFVFYTPAMNESAARRLELESRLYRAVEREEFLLHYQPQLDTNTGEVIGVEALLRWNDRQRGLIPPGEFISAAEDTGLIVPIGWWALARACTQGRIWSEKGLKPVNVAVNLSVRQFRQKDFIERLASVLNDTGMDPSRLELEFTESTIMEDTEVTIEMLKRLKAMGVRLTIDDFGTGYSSLEYLKRMPIDMLKIAQSFVRDIATSKDDVLIATTIIRIAHSLNIEVIAEGVETEEQLQILRNLNCDKIQGYIFSRPLPADEVEYFLRNGKRVVLQSGLRRCRR